MIDEKNFDIKNKDAVLVSINSLDGMLLHKENTNPSKSMLINLKLYTNGLYLVRFFNGEGKLIRTEKLTIIR